jgi:hypothetical protein
MAARDKVFISYSHDDRQWLDLLLRALALLIREQPNAVWWDGRIGAGQEWREEIQRSLASAKVAILLVSQSFLASEFILNEELPAILEKARTEGVAILWSLVRNCQWENTPLYRYQAVRLPQSRTMKAWNALSEAEFDDLLKILATETASRLSSDLAPLAEPPAPEPVPLPAPQAETDHRSAAILLEGVEDLTTVAEIGDFFVLRRRWPDAAKAFNDLIDLAAPYQEISMARGYEKLGLVRRQETKWQLASECWRLAQVLYRRTGQTDKVSEIERLLREIPAAGQVSPAK